MSFGSTRQSQSSEPWKTQQPYLEAGYSRANQLYEGRPQIAGTEGLEQSLFDRALAEVQSGGSPVVQGLGNFIQGSLGSTAGGNPYLDAVGEAGSGWNPYIGSSNPYLGDIQNAGQYGNPYLDNVAAYGDQNPWLDKTFDRASQSVSDRFNQDVIPGINATFGSAGRTGGGLHGQVFGDAAGQYGDALNNLATDIYGGAYESDANRRLQRDVSVAGFGESALNRNLQAQTTAAGFGAGDLDRSSRLYGEGLDRYLAAALGQADLASGDADRTAGLVGTYENLINQGVDRLGSFANPEGRYLNDYLSQIAPALIQSSGSSSGMNFGFK